MNFLSNVNAVRGECKRLFTVLCNCKVIFICFFFIIQSDGWRQCVCTPMVRHFLQGIRQKIHLCRNEDWQIGCSELCERGMQVNTKGPTAFPKGGKMQLNFPDIGRQCCFRRWVQDCCQGFGTLLELGIMLTRSCRNSGGYKASIAQQGKKIRPPRVKASYTVGIGKVSSQHIGTVLGMDTVRDNNSKHATTGCCQLLYLQPRAKMLVSGLAWTPFSQGSGSCGTLAKGEVAREWCFPFDTTTNWLRYFSLPILDLTRANTYNAMW